jgi:hypothetical protein
MATLLCLLGGLISLALIAIVLYVLWWALTTILAALGIAIPATILILLKVIAVLIVVIVVVQAVYYGSFCGYLPWWPAPAPLHR